MLSYHFRVLSVSIVSPLYSPFSTVDAAAGRLLEILGVGSFLGGRLPEDVSGEIGSDRDRVLIPDNRGLGNDLSFPVERKTKFCFITRKIFLRFYYS